MPGVLRILAGRGVWAGVAGLALAAPAAAQPPDDPIAASNRLIDPWVAPAVRLTALEAPWLVPTPEPQPIAPPANTPAAPPVKPIPPGKALLDRLISRRQTDCAPVVVPTPAPVPTAVPDQALIPVVWSAPARQPITPIVPTPTRPMIPCEPVVVTPVVVPPMEPPLPPPRVLTPEDGEQQMATPPPPAPSTPPALPPVQQTVVKTTVPDDEPPARTVTTIRFVEETPPPPAADDATLMAVIRRGGVATGNAADIRAAVERICRGKVVGCQTEVAGERQVRVFLTVHTAADWQRLYDRMQNLPELGEYGLLFQVNVQK